MAQAQGVRGRLGGQYNCWLEMLHFSFYSLDSECTLGKPMGVRVICQKLPRSDWRMHVSHVNSTAVQSIKVLHIGCPSRSLVEWN